MVNFSLDVVSRAMISRLFMTATAKATKNKCCNYGLKGEKINFVEF